MGEGKLLAAGSLTALLLAGSVPGQGPLYRERWSYLHLELRRQEVLGELAGRDRETRIKVAGLLAEADDGIPFRGPARALAMLRAVACDDAFLYRTMVSAFVLPEVVDPDGDNSECRDLHVSLYLPYLVPVPGTASFAVEVRARDGSLVHRCEVGRDTLPEDLRMARPHARVPCGELPDGSYTVRIEALLDGKGPGPRDPTLRHRFQVARGFQARAETAFGQVNVLLTTAATIDGAVLHGLASEVNRVFMGAAGDGDSEALADLQRLESAIANLAAGRPVLAGSKGVMTAALPAAGQFVGVTMELPEGARERPLVVIASGAPAYDATGKRPGEPRTRGPRWLHRQCQRFFPRDRCHLAVLESPGGGYDFALALPEAVAALQKLVPTEGGKVFLVLEGEAAVAMSFAAADLGRIAKGVAMVTSGALSRQALEQVGSLAIMACPTSGHPGSDGLARTADLVAGKYGAVNFAGRFALEPGADRPWLLGVPLSAPAVAAFAFEVFAR